MGTRCGIIKTEHLSIEKIGGRAETEARINVCNGYGFKLGARRMDVEESLRNRNTQTFIVEEEEKFLLPDRATYRPSPLIGDIERTRQTVCLVKPHVGIENSAIPPVLRVSMKLAGSRFSDVIYVPARCAAELP